MVVKAEGQAILREDKYPKEVDVEFGVIYHTNRGQLVTDEGYFLTDQ